MSLYIDAEWLLNFFEPYPNDYQTPLVSLRACVDDAPSIDIVRCRECRYWHNGECWGIPYRGDYDTSIDTKADDFCSYGEREGE
jgi:hypothetical protein